MEISGFVTPETVALAEKSRCSCGSKCKQQVTHLYIARDNGIGTEGGVFWFCCDQHAAQIRASAIIVVMLNNHS